MPQDAQRDTQAMWRAYRTAPNDRLRNVLIEMYLPLVRQIAQRIRAKLPREVELDDLISSGVFGLMYAVEAYDPDRAVRFETYCASRVRGAILDELRSWDWVPRLARLRAHRLAAAMHDLRLELGREPTEDELAARMDISAGELRKTLRDGSLVKLIPMSGPLAGASNAEDQDLPAALQDKRVHDRLRAMDREDLNELISSGLSRAEQLIIILYYFEQMTMKEIGLTLDLSESRVSQMHSSILLRLQNQIEGRQPSGKEEPSAAEAA